MKETLIPDSVRFFCPGFWSEPCQYELEVFEQKLQSFIPSEAFDAHAHLWDCRQLAVPYEWPTEEGCAQNVINIDIYQQRQQRWMGQKAPQNVHWIYEWNSQSWPEGNPVFVGLESLLALQRACETTQQSADDIENIFHRNARKTLAL
ncbi:MAG: hypothetical protein ABI210_01800 [Abditibacteriaceae bacterium]